MPATFLYSFLNACVGTHLKLLQGFYYSDCNYEVLIFFLHTILSIIIFIFISLKIYNHFIIDLVIGTFNVSLRNNAPNRRCHLLQTIVLFIEFRIYFMKIFKSRSPLSPFIPPLSNFDFICCSCCFLNFKLFVLITKTKRVYKLQIFLDYY